MIPFRHHVSDCRNEDYYYVTDDRVTLPKASAELAARATKKEQRKQLPAKSVLNSAAEVKLTSPQGYQPCNPQETENAAINRRLPLSLLIGEVGDFQ
jgi:hypothetical protein